MAGLTWGGPARDLDCRICGTRGTADGVVTTAGPDGAEIHGVRCATCGALDLLPVAGASGSDDVQVDEYVEGGAGVGTIATALAAVEPARVRRFLDVGCNYGFALDLARFAHGWEVLGIDPSYAAVRGAAELGVPIVHDFLTTESDLGGTFDLILASEVIEHVPAPLDLARVLRRHAGPTGIVLLTTPAAEHVTPESPEPEVVAALSAGLHTVLATRDGLRDLLREAGFAVAEVRREGLTLVAFATDDTSAPAPHWDRHLPPAVLEDYYAHRAAEADPSGTLAVGTATRLVRSLVARGAFAEAEKAIPRMVETVRARHGVDLDDPDAALAALHAGADASWALPGAAHAIGMTCLLSRDDVTAAERYLALAQQAAIAWIGTHPTDLDALDVRFEAAVHRAVALARTRPADAAALALELPEHLDTSTPDGRDRVAGRRCHVLVELVARGRYDDAGPLVGPVADAAPRLARGDGRWSTSALDALLSLGMRALNTGDPRTARLWFTTAADAAGEHPDDAHAQALAVVAREHVTLAAAQGAVEEVAPLRPVEAPVHHGLDVYWCDASGVYLEGWAHTAPEPASGVSVEVGGTSVRAARRPRPDLAAFWPGDPHVVDTGFAAYVPGTPHGEVTLVVHTARGDHRVPLDLPDHPLPRHEDVPELEEEELLAELAAAAPPGPVLWLGSRTDRPDEYARLEAPFAGRVVRHLDIHAGPGVDVVADVHALSTAVPAGEYALVVSRSLLEHVAAPWLVAAEIGKVLAPGGLTCHVVPWTWPTHAQPNDFWRLSDAGLRQLFGPATGFRTLRTGMAGGVTVTPSAQWREHAYLMPAVASESGAWVVAEKVGPPAGPVSWPVDAADSAEVARRYPVDGLAPAAPPVGTTARADADASRTPPSPDVVAPGTPAPVAVVPGTAAPVAARAALADARPGAATAHPRSAAVTAILPLYQGAGYVQDALRSIAAQTLLPVEVLVVDDGSTDGGGALAAAFDSPVPIRVLRQDNAGQSAARNTAAAAARGDLLAFLDQDDTWYPQHLARLVRPFERSQHVAWSYSDFDEIDGEGGTVTRSYIRTYQLPHPHRTLLELLASDLMVVPSASVLRADAYREVGGFDPQLVGYEDDDLFIRMFRAGWHAEFVRESLTRFRVHATSTSAGERFRASRVAFLDKLARTTPDDVRMQRYYVRDLVVPRLFQITLDDYVTALRSGDLDAARAIAGTAAQVAAYGRPSARRRRRLRALERPELVQAALRARAVLPSWLRPSVHTAFDRP
ncbi:hypothetical protein CTKZ_30530 [Cellulomonas algicola]|uniref:Glycosyltransferase 2-like domain-containing protein n=1 Tax=Cellulomonas algicola TaxID=2071633 RepID=A0A401V3P2_9CELL|nr:glycosyltransferase [Cellulomonas algicola]GCD21491.1 hypothetical protein CTKZ_30530 [Cellulomonas algicola]